MSKTRHRYDDGFKKNAVKLSYASNKTVKEIAGVLRISVSLLYGWRKKYTPEGEKTQFATMEEENQALKLENAELRIECDMLKSCGLFRQGPKVKAREKYMFIESHPEYVAGKWRDTLTYPSEDITAGRTKRNNDKKKWMSTRE